jgi:hypothetical protein
MEIDHTLLWGAGAQAPVTVVVVAAAAARRR